MAEDMIPTDNPEAVGDRPESKSSSNIGRRQILKAAGVGLAATAASLTAGKAFAEQTKGPLIEQPTSHLPIPKPVEELVCHDDAPGAGEFCGTIGPPGEITGNQIEVVVPAGRRVFVRQLEPDETPLAEVLVRVSEEIRRDARFILLASAIPIPLPG